MINKIVDSLNWIYIGIAGIIFGVVSWLGIMAASAFTKKTASLHWNEHLNVVSTQAAEKTIIKIENRLTDFLQEIKESNFNLFEIQKDNIRIEVNKFLKPVKEGLEVLQKSHKKTEKEVTKIKEEIAEIKKELEISKASRHESKGSVEAVMSLVLEKLRELTPELDELKSEPKKFSGKKILNGLYNHD